MNRLLMMFLTFGALFGAVNKGFCQTGKQFLPIFAYRSEGYTLEDLMNAKNDPAVLASFKANVTQQELILMIEEMFAYYVEKDNLTIEGTRPTFPADYLDSMVLRGYYEYRNVKFPNSNYKVSAKDTKQKKVIWGSGATAGTFSVGCLNPNFIPGIDNPGSYHLWPFTKGNCDNGLKALVLDFFPSKVPVKTAPAPATYAVNDTTYTPGKIIIKAGDTIIREGDVIYKEADTYYQEPSGYQYQSGYSYQPNYYGGGYSSGCNFGISAGFSFGYGYGGGYSNSCGGGYSNNYGYCGGNYGGGYYGGGDNYYNYYTDNSINNSFNTDYTNSFNDYQIPFTPPIKVDLPNQQGGGYEDGTSGNNDDDDNGGNGGGDVPGQQGSSDDNGKWAASGSGRNPTAISWSKTSAGIKTTEASSLPSFADNKTGVVKNTESVTTRNSAWSPNKSTTVASREETAQRSTVEYRGREGAIKAEEDRMNNTNNQSRYNVPDQEMRGREGAAVVASRNEGVGNLPTRTSDNATASKVGERSGTATNASREQSVQRNRNTIDQSSGTSRTTANIEAKRTSSSSNGNVSSKRQTNQGGGSVSQRPGTNNGGGGSVSDRPGTR